MFPFYEVAKLAAQLTLQPVVGANFTGMVRIPALLVVVMYIRRPTCDQLVYWRADQFIHVHEVIDQISSLLV